MANNEGDPVRWGSFVIKIKAKIEKPVYLYYVLENFYQNHMWYSRSVDSRQLRDGIGWTVPSGMEESYCGELTFIKSENGNQRIRYPCGLIASSVFTDSYWLEIRAPGESSFAYMNDTDDAENIAWKDDFMQKCRNPTDYKSSQSSTRDYIVDSNEYDFWLLEHFPPIQCRWIKYTTKNNIKFKPVYTAWRMRGDHKIVDCDNWGSSKPSCKFSFLRNDMSGKTCDELNTEVQDGVSDTNTYLQEYDIGENFGMQQGHFVNWMRTAGLSTFRKLYSKIDQDIEPGTDIRVNFISRHDVPKVEKSILIGNLSWLGGRNSFAEHFSLFSSIGAFILALVLLFLAMKKKAKGDTGTKVLCWN